jgi:hypothetical protein
LLRNRFSQTPYRLPCDAHLPRNVLFGFARRRPQYDFGPLHGPRLVRLAIGTTFHGGIRV